jgi:hypothetical protein
VFDTAANVISDAAIELGLVSEAVSDPFSSSDTKIVQLVALLKNAGRELVLAHPWSHLQLTHTFTTSAGVAQYTLPLAVSRLVDQTQWNRSTQLPLGGPLSAQGWQHLKADSVGGVVDVYFRQRGATLELHPTPASAMTIAMEYLTRYWVAVDDSFTPEDDVPTAAGNFLLFNSVLLTRKLKLAWLEAKGFDASAAMRAYEDAWAMATSADGSSPVLRLDRSSRSTERPLDEYNMPVTRFGV